MPLLQRFNMTPPPNLREEDLREWGVVIVAYPLSAFVHAVLLALFWAVGSTPMLLFNIGSVLFYVMLSMMAFRGKLAITLTLFIAEILSHALFATVVLGSSSGFHYWLMLGLLAPFLSRRKHTYKLTMLLASLAGLAVVQLLGATVTPMSPLDPELIHGIQSGNLIGTGLAVAFAIHIFGVRADELEGAVREQHARSEELLHNILPTSTAERLKRGEETIADRIEETTIFFSDIVGFTTLSASIGPEKLVAMLNRIFVELDRLCDRYGLEKIKTIGDAYMAAAGLPEPRDDHATAAADFALDMLQALDVVNAELGTQLAMRIGLHTGPVVAGVIGARKFSYDVWGDTVNTAARMESHGLPGRIQISATTQRALADAGYTFEPRGAIDIKGKGNMETFFLTGRASA